MSYAVEVILDSIMPKDHRLTTLKITMPRIVLAEFNTHRMLTRNFASSRAISAVKMIKAVMDSPFVPKAWMKEHTGMQGTEYFNDLENGTANTAAYFENQWLDARDQMAHVSGQMSGGKLSKQITNRLLEPWMWTTVLSSATEWENFIALRAHEAAEIHIQYIAELMLNALNKSTPQKLNNDWHIPYGDQMDDNELMKLYEKFFPEAKTVVFQDLHRLKVQIAVARCAQTSYTVVDTEGKPMDYFKLKALHDRLYVQGHWSPFEHCALAMDKEMYKAHILQYYSVPKDMMVKEYGWCGNFRGFIQYRKMCLEENRIDNRLIKKSYGRK